MQGPADPEEFRKSPRTFLKTLQEIFCDTSDRMVFPEHKSDKYLFDNPRELERALSAIIIDPRNLTDTLLSDLGLNDAIPAKGLRKEEKLRIRAKAIPRIKEMLANLRPVKYDKPVGYQPTKYFRLMYVAEGEQEGKVIGTQHIRGQKKIFSTDIHGAERRITHIEKGMSAELHKLGWLEMALGRIRDRLADWETLKTSDERSEITERLTSVVDELKMVNDKTKKEMKQKIKDSLTIDDSRGRPNPSATMTKLTRAITLLQRRRNNIERIWQNIGRDKAVLKGLLTHEYIAMASFAAEVERFNEHLRILRAGPLSQTDREKIIRNLRIRAKETESMKIEPYRSFGEVFRKQIDATIEELSQEKDSEAQREFVKTYCVAKIARAYMKIQEVLYTLSVQPYVIAPQELETKLRGINDGLSPKNPVAPEVGIQEFEDAFGEIYHMFNSLYKRIEEGGDYDTMKKRIKEIDWKELVKSLN